MDDGRNPTRRDNQELVQQRNKPDINERDNVDTIQNIIDRHIQAALDGMRVLKPTIGSPPIARYCAIAITDLEKVAAYWRHYLAEDTADKPDEPKGPLGYHDVEDFYPEDEPEE